VTPRGRRPAGEDTRGTILAAALAEFSTKGYDGASMRGIARAAGVDPALVHHNFEGKSALFVESMDLPGNPGEILAGLVDGPVENAGERVVRGFLAVWEPPERRARLVALLRSAVVNEQAAEMLREFLTREVFGRVAATTGLSDVPLRASLAASQMMGVAVMRYVFVLGPLAEADAEDLVAQLAPTLQRYLTDPALVP
jgi:AcrR family transcriptional regulator